MKNTYFLDKGDCLDELLIRFEGEDKELFDICSFECDETGNALAHAELFVKAANYINQKKVNHENAKPI